MRTDPTLPGITIIGENAGLITQCLSVGDPATTATAANRFGVGCLIQDIATGVNYANVGTSGTPNWGIASGDITSVIAGDGLIGGGSTGNVTLSSGIQITNKSGGILSPGNLVFVTMVGAVLSAFKVDAVGSGGPPYAILVVKDAIAVDAVGYVYAVATITGLDTSAASVGDYVALSPTVAGEWVNISGQEEFESTVTTDVVGMVLTSHASTGQILFFPGYTFTIAQPVEEAMMYQNATNISGGAFSPGDLVAPVGGINADYRRPCFQKADANAGILATHVVLSSLPNNQSGTVYPATMVGNLNTNAAAAVGDFVYLSETAGGWTVTAPTAAGSLQQVVGVVTVKSATVGIIYFFPGFSYIKKIGTSELQAGLVPSHVIKVAATTAAYGGGGTSNAFTATGLLATDIVSAVIRASTNAVSIAKAVPTADTLTVTFSADPGAGTTVDYIAARAVV